MDARSAGRRVLEGSAAGLIGAFELLVGVVVRRILEPEAETSSSGFRLGKRAGGRAAVAEDFSPLMEARSWLIWGGGGVVDMDQREGLGMAPTSEGLTHRHDGMTPVGRRRIQSNKPTLYTVIQRTGVVFIWGWES